MNTLKTKIPPPLDPAFVPASLWNQEFHQLVKNDPHPVKITLGLLREKDLIFRYETSLLSGHSTGNDELNYFYLERLFKHLLWHKGGHTLFLHGASHLLDRLRQCYSPQGKRSFDRQLIGQKVYGTGLHFENVLPPTPSPLQSTSGQDMAKNSHGHRVGIDLGGSDRKYAAVSDGKVVESGEILWDPYPQADPDWHYDQINDCIKRAAAKLPRVDAIGVSAAGIYVDNQARAGSLFRGISDDLFKQKIVPLFLELQKEWKNVPLVVANDGDVTALAGAMALQDAPVLGIA
ncbi:MAG: ROK family protein, partial [Pseudomonadota bacterium]